MIMIICSVTTRYENISSHQTLEDDPNVGIMLAHRLRSWSNIQPALIQLSVFAESVFRCYSFIGLLSLTCAAWAVYCNPSILSEWDRAPSHVIVSYVILRSHRAPVWSLQSTKASLGHIYSPHVKLTEPNVFPTSFLWSPNVIFRPHP